MLGLFQGHSATLLRIFPYAAIKFMAYDQIEHVCPSDRHREYPPLIAFLPDFNAHTRVSHECSTIYSRRSLRSDVLSSAHEPLH